MNYTLYLKIIFIVASFSVSFFSCQKGQPVELEKFMKLDMEAYYEDSSVYSTISFNGQQIGSGASVEPGGDVVDLLVNPAEIKRPAGDTGRLEVSIIKKNNPNLIFDSVINVENFNDFLLIQLDPLQRPYLINKRIASSSLPQPTGDSLQARFYFSSNDPNIKNYNYSPARRVTKVDLELWALKEVDSVLQPVNINRKFRVEADRLTDKYISFKKGEQYGWRILDVSPGVASNNRIIETYEYFEEYRAFTRGFIELADNQKFQTIKIMLTYDINLFQPGINGNFLFGLN